LSKYGLDKFYTSEKTVNKILSLIDIKSFSLVIEPSAGNGAFSKKMENCIALDLEPDDNSITKQDFLKTNFQNIKNTLVIGNPPFGKNGSLALKFIKHSAEFADMIAFILPRSFKKDSFYHKIPLNFWKELEFDIDEHFIFEGNTIDIPCVFQVYKKNNSLRKINKVMTSSLFTFVKKEEANVSIRRVGVYAGKAFLDIDKSSSSHYFIKVNNPNEFVYKVNTIEWEHNNTVGPRSISKPELISKIEGLNL